MVKHKVDGVVSRRINITCIRQWNRKSNGMKENSILKNMEVKWNIIRGNYELFFSKTILGNLYYILLYMLKCVFLYYFDCYPCFLSILFNFSYPSDVMVFTFDKLDIWYSLNYIQVKYLYQNFEHTRLSFYISKIASFPKKLYSENDFDLLFLPVFNSLINICDINFKSSWKLSHQ